MDINKEFALLQIYLNWRVDRVKPVTDEVMFDIYEHEGYIYEGRKWNDLLSFEQWKKLFKMKNKSTTTT